MEEEQHRLYIYLLLASISVIIIMFAYYYTRTTNSGSSNVIGEAFVENEVPPPGIFPLFIKPVTILCILIVISWFSFIELSKKRVYSLRTSSRNMIKLIFVLATIVSLYELLFNFMLWSLLILKQDGSALNPDKAVNVFPTDRYPVNMVFATKIAVVTFGCSAYALATFWNSSKQSVKN